jgi:DNA-binding LacI/PurR family transcriptional regulator
MFGDTHLQTSKQAAFGLNLQDFASLFFFMMLRACQCALQQATLYISIVKSNDHHLLLLMRCLTQCLARLYKHLQQHGS